MAPIDSGPELLQALRIPPRGGHPALLDSVRSQRGVTPAFGYGALHPSTSGTSTHLSTSLPSAHYQRIRLPRQRRPSYGWSIQSAYSIDRVQDHRGSPRFRDASISARAVLSDPAGVSGPLASCGSLLVPSKFSTLSASGSPNHEAQSLHVRYGPDVALPTLSPCRCLHKPKARFQVERLILLAWAGIAPAGSARLRLARRRTIERPSRAPSSPSCA